MWRRIIQHLLPRARAWRAFPGTMLDRFLTGLAELPATIREALDKLWSDLIPEDTRFLAAWERQFGLRPRALSEAQRRQRLRARWQATGGQSRAYIQRILRESGFDVYVYEWFSPDAERAGVQGINQTSVLALDDGTVLETRLYSAENPARIPGLSIGSTVPRWRCGTTGARCGVQGVDNRQVRILSVDGGVLTIEDGALSLTGYYTVRCGRFFAAGYMLVNRGLDNPAYPPAPTDPAQFPYVLYIGGRPFGFPALIPESRRDDFEALCLEICPAQQWLGIIVTYT